MKFLPAIIIPLVAFGITMGLWANRERLRDTPSPFIPYCPTQTFGQPRVYYPCMYSSREFSA